jgi:ribosomal-protein-alanine N-acetyltransferase
MQNQTIVAEGANVYLRRLTEADCTQRYVGWLNDPLVNRYLETRLAGVQTVNMVLDFVRHTNARPNEHLFGIFLRESHLHVGNIKLGPVHPYHRIGDVSLLLGERSQWGKGLASEAIALVTRYGFEQLDVRKLCASMYIANEGSRRAFIKCGYVEEGIRKNHYLLDDGPSDIVLLGLNK